MGGKLLLPFERSVAKRALVFLQVQVNGFFVITAVTTVSERTPAIPTRLRGWSSLQRR